MFKDEILDTNMLGRNDKPETVLTYFMKRIKPIISVLLLLNKVGHSYCIIINLPINRQK